MSYDYKELEKLTKRDVHKKLLENMEKEYDYDYITQVDGEDHTDVKDIRENPEYEDDEVWFFPYGNIHLIAKTNAYGVDVKINLGIHIEEGRGYAESAHCLVKYIDNHTNREDVRITFMDNDSLELNYFNDLEENNFGFWFPPHPIFFDSWLEATDVLDKMTEDVWQHIQYAVTNDKN